SLSPPRRDPRGAHRGGAFGQRDRAARGRALRSAAGEAGRAHGLRSRVQAPAVGAGRQDHPQGAGGRSQVPHHQRLPRRRARRAPRNADAGAAGRRMTVVRYAPSPTGRLHIGNARPALLNWLFALAHAGEYMLRLDDTDTARLTEEYARGIVEDLAWLGITPARLVRQSERTA